MSGSNFTYRCPKCKTLFSGYYHISGKCPKCGNSYFWYDEFMYDCNWPNMVWESHPNHPVGPRKHSLTFSSALEFLKKWVKKVLGG